MKLVNCEVGTKVVIKASQSASLRFYTRNVGQLCTVLALPDADGDVQVQIEDGSTDIGHHTNLRKYKGDA